MSAWEDRCFAVPKGQARIAQRFNAGLDAQRSRVPKGRLRSNPTRHPSAVPSGLVCPAASFPALKRRAILDMSLRDKGTWRLPVTQEPCENQNYIHQNDTPRRWSAGRIRRRLLGGGGQIELGKTLSEVPRRRRQGPDENGPAERREGLHRSKGAGGIKGRQRHQDH